MYIVTWQALVCREIPRKYLEVFALPVLLGDNTMFVCRYPVRLLLKFWCISDVFHASLISGFFGWACWNLSRFTGSWVVVWPYSELDFLDVVENTFALLHDDPVAVDDGNCDTASLSSADDLPWELMRSVDNVPK